MKEKSAIGCRRCDAILRALEQRQTSSRVAGETLPWDHDDLMMPFQREADAGEGGKSSVLSLQSSVFSLLPYRHERPARLRALEA